MTRLSPAYRPLHPNSERAMSDLVWSRDGANWPNREASTFVEAAGLRWHLQRMGEGPSLLLIHGTGAATHSWRGLMPILAQHFAVIALDLPGHGFTQSPPPQRLSLPGMASDAAELVRALAVKPEIVIGHSAGAAILARMCLDGKIAPRLLVSLNGAFMPFGGVANHLLSPLAKLLVMNPFAPRLFAWQASTAGAVERLIRNTGSTIDARGIELYRKLVCSPAHVAAALRMMANWRLEPLLHDLPQLATNLLLIAAANDRSISPDVTRQVREIVPQATIELLPGLGHLAHEEQPQLIADLIMRYAARAAVAGEVSPAVN
jgi:magnesium chelatase accessory protein